MMMMMMMMMMIGGSEYLTNFESMGGGLRSSYNFVSSNASTFGVKILSICISSTGSKQNAFQRDSD